MPRIPQENAEQITNGEVPEGGNRKAFQGYVLCRLVEAEESSEKESGYAGQDLKFEVVEPRTVKGWFVWEYISYNPNTTWKWRDFFEAFGYEADSDTTELVEDGAEGAEDPAYVILECDMEVRSKGKRKGKMATRVVDYLDPSNPENYELIGVILDDSE